MAAFAAHVALKFGRMSSALRSRRWRDELRTDTAHTVPEPPDPDRLVSPDPAPATLSRRGALGLIGSGSLLVGVLSAGQNLGGWTRRVALLAPRGQELDHGPNRGPNGFQVNKTAAHRRITPAETGPSWRLELRGPTPRRLSRPQLMDLDQHTARVAINCVEGWSTGTQAWTGVRLRDLARLAGAADAGTVLVESLQQRGAFRSVTLRSNQIADGDALLALRVNGADLSPDHGFPARVIVPAAPGVHNTKWVARMTFVPAAGDR
jgi:DMSO/TMAO reductase YedYZ molybdopterin-dependent catalytic subunit